MRCVLRRWRLWRRWLEIVLKLVEVVAKVVEIVLKVVEVVAKVVGGCVEGGGCGGKEVWRYGARQACCESADVEV